MKSATKRIIKRFSNALGFIVPKDYNLQKPKKMDVVTFAVNKLDDTFFLKLFSLKLTRMFPKCGLWKVGRGY